MKRRSVNLPPHVDPQRLALGIQQPWAELILRGVKTVEIRSQGTQVRGPIYLYASKQISVLPAAKLSVREHRLDVDALPRGVLVGSVTIINSQPATVHDAAAACLPAELLMNRHGWRLADPERLAEPLPVRFLPYGVWFYPFRRKQG